MKRTHLSFLKSIEDIGIENNNNSSWTLAILFFLVGFEVMWFISGIFYRHNLDTLLENNQDILKENAGTLYELRLEIGELRNVIGEYEIQMKEKRCIPKNPLLK